MNELSEAVVSVLELAEQARIRLDEVPEDKQLALDYCLKSKLVVQIPKQGPEPPMPKTSEKPVADLRLDDLLYREDRGYKVIYFADKPDGIHVQVEGCPVWIYQFKAKVTVLEEPIPERESWMELRITPTGETDLARHRMNRQTAGKAKRTGRPRKDETGKDTLVISALAAYHEYEPGGSIGNYEPATVRGLVNESLSTATISRFLERKFPGRGHKGYVAACRDGKIGHLLALWQDDVSERHYSLREEDGHHEDEHEDD